MKKNSDGWRPQLRELTYVDDGVILQLKNY